MAKIQFNNRQYTVTIPKEIIQRMGWKKGAEVFVGKDYDKNIVYIEKMK
jgi:bifunctional DNA-binding transcriptional regulator/antitoxin component of YhaV-PrlF toxin-antitoxin module